MVGANDARVQRPRRGRTGPAAAHGGAPRRDHAPLSTRRAGAGRDLARGPRRGRVRRSQARAVGVGAADAERAPGAAHAVRGGDHGALPATQPVAAGTHALQGELPLRARPLEHLGGGPHGGRGGAGARGLGVRRVVQGGPAGGLRVREPREGRARGRVLHDVRAPRSGAREGGGRARHRRSDWHRRVHGGGGESAPALQPAPGQSEGNGRLREHPHGRARDGGAVVAGRVSLGGERRSRGRRRGHLGRLALRLGERGRESAALGKGPSGPGRGARRLARPAVAGGPRSPGPGHGGEGAGAARGRVGAGDPRADPGARSSPRGGAVLARDGPWTWPMRSGQRRRRPFAIC
jgi:hypothetical protein